MADSHTLTCVCESAVSLLQLDAAVGADLVHIWMHISCYPEGALDLAELARRLSGHMDCCSMMESAVTG